MSQRPRGTNSPAESKPRAVQAALNDALAALRTGTLVKPSKRTLESFLVGEWLPALRNLRPSTLSNYRTHVRTCVLPALGSIPLQQLSPAHSPRVGSGTVMAWHPRPSKMSMPSSIGP
jgi:hypothetical protein